MKPGSLSHLVKSLEQFHIPRLQHILGFTWCGRVPHTEILRKIGCKSFEATITHHQLWGLGHVLKMPQNRLPRKVLYGKLQQGQRSAGGQRKQYKVHLKTEFKKSNIKPWGPGEHGCWPNTWWHVPRRDPSTWGQPGGSNGKDTTH